MSRFSALLKETAARLDLPQPVKAHILLEMAADLEDLFEAYRERGLNEEEAAQRVKEKFDASDDTLIELTRLHRSTMRRRLDRFSEQASTLWEKLTLVAVLLFVAAFTGILVLHPGFFSDVSFFAWPGAVLGVLAIGIFLAKANKFYREKNPALRNLRRGLPSLLFIACAAFITGVFGFFMSLQSTMYRIAEDYETTGAELLHWMVGSAATMTLCLLVAILAALLWFVLTSKVKRIELQHVARLLEEV